MIQLPHLETDITQACQLSCVGCNHAVPLWRKHGPWTATVDQVYTDLKHLSTFSHAKVWAALGGEPLLNKQLARIVDVAKLSRIADEYEVWTNGLLVHHRRHDDALWSSIDRLVVSRYPGKLTEEDVTEMRALCYDHDIELVIRDEIARPNFMTWLEPAPTSAAVTQKKYDGCAFRRGSNYAASYGYFFACCCGPHIPLLVQGRQFGDDGLLIANASEEDLRAYLTRSEPFGACYVCAGRDTAVKIPWREERNAALWLDKSAGKDGVKR